MLAGDLLLYRAPHIKVRRSGERGKPLMVLSQVSLITKKVCYVLDHRFLKIILHSVVDLYYQYMFVCVTILTTYSIQKPENSAHKAVCTAHKFKSAYLAMRTKIDMIYAMYTHHRLKINNKIINLLK